jgi:hypothetical protein
MKKIWTKIEQSTNDSTKLYKILLGKTVSKKWKKGGKFFSIVERMFMPNWTFGSRMKGNHNTFAS